MMKFWKTEAAECLEDCWNKVLFVTAHAGAVKNQKIKGISLVVSGFFGTNWGMMWKNKKHQSWIQLLRHFYLPLTMPMCPNGFPISAPSDHMLLTPFHASFPPRAFTARRRPRTSRESDKHAVAALLINKAQGPTRARRSSAGATRSSHLVLQLSALLHPLTHNPPSVRAREGKTNCESPNSSHPLSPAGVFGSHFRGAPLFVCSASCWGSVMGRCGWKQLFKPVVLSYQVVIQLRRLRETDA